MNYQYILKIVIILAVIAIPIFAYTVFKAFIALLYSAREKLAEDLKKEYFSEPIRLKKNRKFGRLDKFINYYEWNLVGLVDKFQAASIISWVILLLVAIAYSFTFADEYKIVRDWDKSYDYYIQLENPYVTEILAAEKLNLEIDNLYFYSNEYTSKFRKIDTTLLWIKFEKNIEEYLKISNDSKSLCEREGKSSLDN